MSHGNSSYGQGGQPDQQAYAPEAGGHAGPQADGGYAAAHPPRPSVGFVEAIRLFFKNYANFYGRASRSEYWWVQLWVLLFAVVIGILVAITVIPAVNSGSNDLPVGYFLVVGLASIVGLAVLIPSVALEVRRLHDAGFSGFFVLFRLVSLSIIPVIMCIFPSKPDGVRFDNPDGSQPATA